MSGRLGYKFRPGQERQGGEDRGHEFEEGVPSAWHSQAEVYRPVPGTAAVKVGGPVGIFSFRGYISGGLRPAGTVLRRSSYMTHVLTMLENLTC